ncbi:MAG TPA: RNA polymerase sigma-70 factor [Saprospiraceae bacterium]|nr:RNA polymerase sigma-70 factor [Saprospiraceae bacterium]HRJ14304.1 RNA polymerase sigma-70 factor [Saprospiraceae bacterium]HRK80085.1 RNA polymerase sigma-70 factor [Saprospiraceae bacterium]
MLRSEITDNELMQRLATDGEAAMALIFRRHYEQVCRTVYRVVPQAETAEDIAQEVFLELWKRRNQLTISTSLGAYLRRAALNRALNYVRDQKMKWSDDAELPAMSDGAPGIPEQLEAKELQKMVDQYIDQLPEKCRLVFVLSRFESLSHAEIAEQLDISPKTVENQITKALRFLRNALGPYIGLLISVFVKICVGASALIGVFGDELPKI